MEALVVHKFQFGILSGIDLLETNMDKFAISPDGRFIAISHCYFITIWEVNLPNKIQLKHMTQIDFNHFVQEMVWSHDNRYLFIYRRYKRISIMDVLKGQIEDIQVDYEHHSASISPDWRFLTIGTYRSDRSAVINFQDWKYKKPEHEVLVDIPEIICHTFDAKLWSLNMKYLVSLDLCKISIYRFQRETGRLLLKQRIKQKVSYLGMMAISPDCRYLGFTASIPGADSQVGLIIWDIERGTRCATILPPKEPHLLPHFRSFTWSPNGKYLAIISHRRLHIWSFREGHWIPLKHPSVPMIRNVSWSPCSNYVLIMDDGDKYIVQIREQPHVRAAKLVAFDRATQLCLPTELLAITNGFL